MDLGFLESLELTPVPEKKGNTGRPAAPLEGDLRLHKSGRVVFSDSFRELVGEKWIDLFFANKWLQYPKDQPNVLFLCINDKEKPAKADIKSEGTSVFVKDQFWFEASPALGFEFDLPYIELVLETTEVPVPIALLPKIVQRGADKGADTYVQREDITLRVLSLHPAFARVVDEEPQAEIAEESSDNTEEEAVNLDD